MVNISSEKIKELRAKTGAGMMDCKKALLESDSNVEDAIDWLRKKGIAGANKKAGRDAAEGLIGLAVDKENGTAAIVEINSETDFVAKNSDFQNFVIDISKLVLKNSLDINNILDHKYSYDSNELVRDVLANMIAKIGENIIIRRIAILNKDELNNPIIETYLHNKIGDNLGKIVSLVQASCELNNDKVRSFVKKLSMHIAASRPEAVSIKDLDKDIVDRERAVLLEQVKDLNKPEMVMQKIVDGKLNKFYAEVILLEQNWVIDPSKKVKEVINDFNKEYGCNLLINNFLFYVLGEGIEKTDSNFAEEVQSQIKNF